MAVEQTSGAPRCALVVALGGLVVAGCSTGAAGTTAGQPSSGNKTGTPVPKITKPIDMTQWEKKPCAMVDESVVNTFGKFGTPKSDTTSKDAKEMNGPTCTWTSRGMTLTDVIVTIETVAQRQAVGGKGMQGIYKQNQKFYQPFQVEGHPEYPAAIVATPQGDQDPDCGGHFGVRDDLTVAFTVGGDKPADHNKSCANAKVLVKDILDNIAPK